jgi:hypothetical protein
MFTLWLPPNVWLHGSQSTITGRSARRNGQACRIICWLAASIRWVLRTPFGAPVEPEVNRILAIESPVTAAPAAATAGPGAVAMRSSSRSAPGRDPVRAMAGTPLTASSAAANRSASSAKTAPGRIIPVIARIRAWS